MLFQILLLYILNVFKFSLYWLNMLFLIGFHVKTYPTRRPQSINYLQTLDFLESCKTLGASGGYSEIHSHKLMDRETQYHRYLCKVLDIINWLILLYYEKQFSK